MSLLTFAKTALGSMVKQPVTVCYPQEKLAAPERLRGHIVNDHGRVHLLRHVRAPLPRRARSRSIAREERGRLTRMPAWYAASASRAAPNTA